MEIQVQTAAVESIAADIFAAFVFAGEKLDRSLADLDRICGDKIGDLIASGDFKAKSGDTAVLYPNTASSIKRILLVGLGPIAKCTSEVVRRACGSAVREVSRLGLSSLVIPLWSFGTMAPVEIAQAIVEGVILGGYTFDVHKTSQTPAKPLATLTIAVSEVDLCGAQQGATAGQVIAESVCLARDLSNEPGNYLTPTMLAETAEKVAAEVGLQVEVLDESQMAELGMGSLLGVAQGSEEAAQFIILEHNAGQPDLPTYVVVGKGINFDSGGISLKGADGMQSMKGDMTGAGDTLAIMRTVALLKLPLHVVGLMPCTENLPDGRAFKPGDVLKSMSGLTIEVISTDAEGRLILADALTYAKRYQPKAVVDLATLTGACVIALGSSIAGLMCNTQNLTTALQQASAATGEKIWELPLEEEYNELLDSDVADMKNVGGRPGGTITAGLFLARFASDYPWAHLDIAGKELSEKVSGYTVKGGTGFGVRLIVAWLRSLTS
ncbi:MAG: leucyl aminopeptidase [Anaerolineae bacterium]